MVKIETVKKTSAAVDGVRDLIISLVLVQNQKSEIDLFIRSW